MRAVGDKRSMVLRYLIGSGVGAAAALAVWAVADDERADVVRPKASTVVQAEAIPYAGSRVAATPTSAPHGSPSIVSGPTTLVPMRVTATQKLQVGEFSELMVAIDAPGDVREVSLAVEFDPDFLQVRGSTEGDWAIGAAPQARFFTAEISGAEQRVQIRSAVSGQRSAMTGGNVAIVQFQAVAPGTSSVLIANVTVKDAAGRWLTPAVSPSILQVTVDSVAPPRPVAMRDQDRAERPSEAAVDDGD